MRLDRALILERLRGSFIYVVALVLPLAGALIAIARFSEGDRDEGIRLGALALLGACIFALVFL